MDLTPDSTIIAYNPSDLTIDVVDTIFAPHQRRYVSFLWMRNHYGDPRSVQDMPRIVKLPNREPLSVQARQVELRRVNDMWNIGSMEGLRKWSDIPVIEFYDEEGERILTVYDDPTGQHSSPSGQTIADAAADADRIARLEAQVADLARVAGIDRESLEAELDPAPDPSTPNIPTDDSTATRTTSPWAGADPALMVDEPPNPLDILAANDQ